MYNEKYQQAAGFVQIELSDQSTLPPTHIHLTRPRIMRLQAAPPVSLARRRSWQTKSSRLGGVSDASLTARGQATAPAQTPRAVRAPQKGRQRRISLLRLLDELY